MPRKTLSIAIENLGPLESLNTAFGRPPDGNLSDADLEKLVILAFKSWMSTLLGPERHRSMSELYASWLRQLYTEYLNDEDLTERRLRLRLGFPYGQAAYLSRVLRDERPLLARRRALANLRAALSKKVPEAKQFSKDGRGEDRMVITITKAARLELETVLGELYESGTTVRPLRSEGTLGDYVVVGIVVADFEPLLAEVTKTEKEMKS